MLDHRDQYTHLKHIEEKLGVESIDGLVLEQVTIRSKDLEVPLTVTTHITAIKVSGLVGEPTTVQLCTSVGAVILRCDGPRCMTMFEENDPPRHFEVEVEID